MRNRGEMEIAMPWEKSFDVNEIVDRATSVFWAKGYEATSLADLIKATGINKGSLYNAFGSKKGLFSQSILKYDQEHRRATLVELIALKDPVLAINTLFDGIIAESLADKECKGCLLVNTALDLPNQDLDIAKTVKSGFLDFEGFFETQIQLGQKVGAIPINLDHQSAAKTLLGLVVALRVLSRGVYDEEGLQAIKSHAINIISK